MICPPPPLCGCGCGIPAAYGNKHPEYKINGGYSFFRKGHSNRLREYPKGKDAWNWGMRHTPEAIEKIKAANRRRFGYDEDYQYPRYLNQKDRFSTEYAHWRKSVFERDDYTCQFCERRGGKLNAHHIKPWAYFPKLRFELFNGVTLCTDCHKFYGVKKVTIHGS